MVTLGAGRCRISIQPSRHSAAPPQLARAASLAQASPARGARLQRSGPTFAPTWRCDVGAAAASPWGTKGLPLLKLPPPSPAGPSDGALGVKYSSSADRSAAQRERGGHQRAQEHQHGVESLPAAPPPPLQQPNCQGGAAGCVRQRRMNPSFVSGGSEWRHPPARVFIPGASCSMRGALQPQAEAGGAWPGLHSQEELPALIMEVRRERTSWNSSASLSLQQEPTAVRVGAGSGPEQHAARRKHAMKAAAGAPQQAQAPRPPAAAGCCTQRPRGVSEARLLTASLASAGGASGVWSSCMAKGDSAEPARAASASASAWELWSRRLMSAAQRQCNSPVHGELFTTRNAYTTAACSPPDAPALRLPRPAPPAPPRAAPPRAAPPTCVNLRH